MISYVDESIALLHRPFSCEFSVWVLFVSAAHHKVELELELERPRRGNSGSRSRTALRNTGVDRFPIVLYFYCHIRCSVTYNNNADRNSSTVYHRAAFKVSESIFLEATCCRSGILPHGAAFQDLVFQPRSGTVTESAAVPYYKMLLLPHLLLRRERQRKNTSTHKPGRDSGQQPRGREIEE
jgi:hypothetical protein